MRLETDEYTMGDIADVKSAIESISFHSMYSAAVYEAIITCIHCSLTTKKIGRLLESRSGF